jgi:hypothetical protein
MQNILINSLTEANKYNYENVHKEHLKEFCHAYDVYRLSLRELYFFKTLGQNISGKTILDVGSGTLMTARAIIENCINPVSYTSIDRKEDPTITVSKMIENNKISYSNHHHVDIFEIDIELKDTYDIIIIDIEPHGKEIEVYEKFKKYMKSEHLIILKHIAFIDLFGSRFADIFIEKYNENIKDYFAERSLKYDEIRDIFIIMEEG